MREIQLTQGRVTLVDDEDYEMLQQYDWYAHTPNGGTNWYALTNVLSANTKSGRTTLKMHRLLMQLPGTNTVDHVDGNGLNNQRANLRVCTQQNNLWNVGSRGTTSAYKGVSKVTKSPKGRPWCAQLRTRASGKILYQFFASEEEAARAYDSVAREIHGEFAYLNFSGGEA